MPNAKNEIVWSEPPEDTYEPRSRGVASIRSQLQALVDNPGRWARVHGPKQERQNATSWASQLTKGRFAGVQQGEFEASARSVTETTKSDDGELQEVTQWYVWAKYVGDSGRPTLD